MGVVRLAGQMRTNRTSALGQLKLGSPEVGLMDTDLELAVQRALLATNGGFTGGRLIGELGDVARRLITNLQNNDVNLQIGTSDGPPF